MERMREFDNYDPSVSAADSSPFRGAQEEAAEEMAATDAGLPIGKREIEKARDTLEKYRQGKSALDARIRENEEWYRMRHWEITGHSRNPSEPEPTSAWLLNSLINKHADAMDNYPEPSVLPREAMDKADAEILSEVLPTLLEQSRYEDVYSEKWWKKLKGGTGCTAVTWDAQALNGLGEVKISVVDVLNVFWEPGVLDIQDGANFFRVDVADNEALEREYPQLRGKLGGDDVNTVKYYYDDNVDTSEKTAVVDWYYKRRVVKKTEDGQTVTGRLVTHMVKFAAGEVLFASENLPEMAETGFYAHGKYPFVLDRLFPVAGSPAGFGYLDICKDPQLFIDKLNQVMLMGAALARPRYFARIDGQLNEEEFADLGKSFIHYQGAGNPRDNIMPVDVPSMPGYVQDLLAFKVNELKETSGNTDFGQGVSSAGVTAASAIAALQEAGGKQSRDMLKASYRAFTEECYLIIELIRQFYTVQRTFRIVGENGAEQFVSYSNANIAPQAMGPEFGLQFGPREPVFDIKVRASKANAFSRLSQNELAKEFYSAGFFNPQMSDQALACIEMMDFEGKDAVVRRIEQNGTMYQQLMQALQIIDQLTGGAAGLTAQAAAPNGESGMGNGESSAAAGSRNQATAADKVRDRVQEIGNPTR